MVTHIQLLLFCCFTLMQSRNISLKVATSSSFQRKANPCSCSVRPGHCLAEEQSDKAQISAGAAVADGRDFFWQWCCLVQREAGTCWPCCGLGKPCAVGHGCCPREMRYAPPKDSFWEWNKAIHLKCWQSPSSPINCRLSCCKLNPHFQICSWGMEGGDL